MNTPIKAKELKLILSKVSDEAVVFMQVQHEGRTLIHPIFNYDCVHSKSQSTHPLMILGESISVEREHCNILILINNE